MIFLVTDNSPLGMLTLSTMEMVAINFYPLRIYDDPLYEIKDYLSMCKKPMISNIINVCNNSPWSDLILSEYNAVDAEDNEQRCIVNGIKREIYDVCGWKPDYILNIYDKKSSDSWREKISVLSSDTDIPIISLDANDPRFEYNLKESVQMFERGGQKKRKCTMFSKK